MRSLRARLTIMFLLLVGLSVLGSGVFVSLLLKASYIDSLTDRLTKEGYLLAGTIDWSEAEKNPRRFQKQAQVNGKALKARVTLINRDGTVLGDSQEDPRQMGNLRRDREVQKVLRKKTGYTRVTTKDRLHVYIPVQQDGQVLGVIRLSLFLENINRSLSQVWFSLIGGLAMAYVAAALLGSRIASRITKPIEEITQVAVDIARDRYYRRVSVKERDEIGRLGSAINRMAAGLKNQLDIIRKSERRLISVIETMESGLLLVDAERRVNLANQAIHRFYDLKPGELVNKILPRRAVFHELHTLLDRCLYSGERIREELHLYYPEERILEASLTPIWGESEGMGVVVLLHDITPIRRLEKMRTDFVANVSHELKTPVTSLRGFAETLLDGADEDPQMRREFLEIIQAESLRLERLIGDLLDLSRIESKKLSLNLQEIPIHELIQSIVKTVEKQIKKKDLELQVKVDGTFSVRVDKDRFSQILINLLSNSMAYTPAGGKITVSAGKEGEEWVVSVADTGIGIPEEDLPRIFERFYRVDKARSRQSGGTGLGLAIVKHLVEVHHGKIHVKSQVGKGTEFILRFPL
ncbi:PAS domain-containing sensor histidine kinase [Marinithermofilum abyssi]|uniref:histidine kinase n=1 Tax=Marinithermofilum abyssi TaxID=1571185 RepID=A0A8J2VGL9_9BACL|nr:ATP-binding protein [Marinithermofilum abyssi]GGE17478.1 PAS domain-containing sensor histidine kinase [Marinithermofilum abyssi]